MPSQSRRFLFFILTLIILVLFGVGSSLAQSASTAALSSPDTHGFPHLTAYLDVHDPSGAFVHGLSPQDVTLQENSLQIPVGTLQEQKPGVQFVIAVSPGESFAIRDSLGVSRFEYLVQGILAGAWVNQPPADDDFSLLTMGGPQATHLPDPASIHSFLQAYKPDPLRTASGLEILASAMQVASDPLARPGMERAILFITPPQPTEVSLGLQSIVTTAVQQNIRVNVWLVASQEVFALPETDLLRNLAVQTRGSFFAFSRDEPVPDLETLLEPLRYIYQLGYESKISAAGTHQVSAQVNLGGEQVTTLPQSFELDLQAPVPVLLPLPSEIIRSFLSQPTPGSANDSTDLTPVEQAIQVQVNFIDGYDRPLARTSLYIDGLLYAENTSPPFDRFTWDLRPYTQDSVHKLSVEVADSLGLISHSGEATVKITVPGTTQGVIATLSQKGFLLVGVIVLISASILVLVLILGGRIRPKPHPGQAVKPAGSMDKTRPTSYRERKRRLKDPVTQPVKIATMSSSPAKSRFKAWRERFPRRKIKETPVPALAYLIPLIGTTETTLPAPFKITSDETTLGNDPQKATLVIPDPALNGLHARIHHEGSSFSITDEGTVAGTWVNYDTVPATGTPLEHADIIHLGTIGFRFNLAHPGQVRKIVITPLEPKL